MSEQESPYAIPKGRDQEAALIGSVLRRPAIFQDMRELVKPCQFDYLPYRWAWEAMNTLAKNEQGIDVLTVGDELDRIGLLKEWVLHDLPSKTGRLALSFAREQGQPQNAKDYASNVVDYAAKREILQVMNRGAYWSQNGRRANDILMDLEKNLSAINPGAALSRSTETLIQAMTRAADRTERAAKDEISFIKSGYLDLDKMITGYMEPDLTIVAGLPGSGKTAFLASQAKNILEQKKRIAFFTLEMGNEQVAMRFISMESGVDYQTQMTGKLSFEQWSAYYRAIETITDNGSGLFLNDLPAITPNRIKQELRRLWPIDLLMVDYLQLAGSDGKYERRDLEVASVARGLKAICKDFHIPAIVAAQLNRAGAARAQDDKRPILSDLGESSELEKAADKIIFLYRPANTVVTEIVIAKQRNGPTGICQLNYFGSKTRFENCAVNLNLGKFL